MYSFVLFFWQQYKASQFFALASLINNRVIENCKLVDQPLKWLISEVKWLSLQSYSYSIYFQEKMSLTCTAPSWIIGAFLRGLIIKSCSPSNKAPEINKCGIYLKCTDFLGYVHFTSSWCLTSHFVFLPVHTDALKNSEFNMCLEITCIGKVLPLLLILSWLKITKKQGGWKRDF